MFRILVYLLLVSAMFAGVWKHRRGASWGIPLALLCLLLFILAMIRGVQRGDPALRQALRRELAFEEVLGRWLGQEIQRRFPSGHVVVIPTAGEWGKAVESLRREIKSDERVAVVWPDIEAELSALRKSMADRPNELWPEDPEAMLRMELSVSAGRVNRALERHSVRPDVLVFFCTLPSEIEELAFWNHQPRPAVILASGQDAWNQPHLAEMLRKGFVHAVVVTQTGGHRPGAALPGDLDTAFAERYLWITADNLESLPPSPSVSEEDVEGVTNSF
jgi:hypothetical protein